MEPSASVASFGPYLQAIQFDEAMLRGFKVRQDDGCQVSPLPAAIASGAFAIELHLKALLMASGKRVGREHHLQRLFDALPLDLRSSVLSGYAEYTREIPQMGYIGLIAMAKAFERWRYIYEDPKLADGTDPFAMFGLIYGAATTYRQAGFAPREASRSEVSTMRWLMSESPFLRQL